MNSGGEQGLCKEFSLGWAWVWLGRWLFLVGVGRIPRNHKVVKKTRVVKGKKLPKKD